LKNGSGNSSDEKQQLKEFNSVLMDLGEFLNKQLTSLRQQDLFDEDVNRREEGRIVLDRIKSPEKGNFSTYPHYLENSLCKAHFPLFLHAQNKTCFGHFGSL
jgi:hypothetical protein